MVGLERFPYRMIPTGNKQQLMDGIPAFLQRISNIVEVFIEFLSPHPQSLLLPCLQPSPPLSLSLHNLCVTVKLSWPHPDSPESARVLTT